MKKVSISHISNEHNYWLRSLDFYKSEIGILKNILTEIAQKNTGSEAMKEVEHFQNQFKVQLENIDQLSHNIHTNLDNISKQAQQPNAGYIDGALLVGHTALGEKFTNEEHVIADTIRTFRRFAEQWM